MKRLALMKMLLVGVAGVGLAVAGCGGEGGKVRS